MAASTFRCPLVVEEDDDATIAATVTPHNEWGGPLQRLLKDSGLELTASW